MRLRQLTGLGVAAVSVAALAACGSDDGGVPVVNLYGGASDVGFDKIIAACNKEADGRYRIVGNLLPSDADGQREQFVRRLAAHDDSLDLLGMDVTWTAEFAEAGWIREITGEQATAATEDTLDPPIQTAMWDDKLYGIPKHTNVQLLWYRKSLVPDPPTTWDGVIERAKQLKSEGKPYVVAFTGAQYEGYVVGFNTVLSSLGGTLVNDDSTQVTVDDATVQALTILEQLADSGVASASLSNSQEPEVFAQLQNGEAAFAINWPYVLSSMREADPEIAKDLGFARLPEFADGKESRATLGGMNYAISSYSKHPDEAYDAAMCLRSPEHQLQTALEAGNPPVARSVYEDGEFQKAYPMYQVMLDELETAVPRPVTPLYQNISTIVSTTLSPPSGIRPEQTAEKLESSIQDAIDGKGILP
ncbi:ABC transporter substrate-binding protein [Phycicoccus endophyticus]|uniref:ABC transporter substrate-binding protein n=1 Tax=Phycicoccus endophyticus TaxID=1690220 RepID=A0A7G9QYD0_9MICO|nr:ABC transporter substrate-binding protein [Phycicoccus endophyticus]NHI19248.1 ABC transporter substrate-binding protein [Phycicoccus endophyticus]QNN48355.1 ABC transporter substrate-binding protein [Phycicoccus endophyticus]GGL41298.1 sugar ABC transporter substrate-binding protein [Phycicoccus endophyticus]